MFRKIEICHRTANPTAREINSILMRSALALYCRSTSIMSSLMRLAANRKMQMLVSRRSGDDEEIGKATTKSFFLRNDKSFYCIRFRRFFLFIYAPLCHYSHCRCIADCNCRRILGKVFLLNQKKRFAGAIEESSSDKSFYGEKFSVELELAFPGSDANSMCSTTLNGLRLGSRR